ncbi:MAG: hypothetical protein P1P86_11985 [Bacteroidales bacterium]|nr:hypothetical protein [Bacteroidales bacterium]
MKERRTLLSYHDLTVEVETTPGKELLDHMHQTVMGQPGGLQYHHTDLEDRMKSGDENYFMYLRKSGKMLGSVGFVGKPGHTGGVAHDSWLIRYFSIKAPIKGVPKKRKSKEDLQDENKRKTVLGRFIQPVFAQPHLLREGESRSNPPSVIFAVIDQTNLRSMNFSTQMGLETIGSLAGFSFSRLRPRRSGRIEPVEESERGIILAQIREYYKDYSLFYPDSIFKNNDYYVIKKGGKMVAGLQIYQVSWKIVDFGSRLANRSAGLLSLIPGLRKRVNKKELSFLAFDAIYCEPGNEKRLYELMEGVLERNGHYMAMIMMDQKSDLYRIFKSQKRLGLLHKVMGTHFADIRVRFNFLPEEVQQQFYERPTYIPTYDNS